MVMLFLLVIGLTRPYELETLGLKIRTLLTENWFIWLFKAVLLSHSGT